MFDSPSTCCIYPDPETWSLRDNPADPERKGDFQTLFHGERYNKQTLLSDI